MEEKKKEIDKNKEVEELLEAPKRKREQVEAPQ